MNQENFMSINRGYEIQQVTEINSFLCRGVSGLNVNITDEFVTESLAIHPVRTLNNLCVFVGGIVYRGIRTPNEYILFVNIFGDNINEGDTVFNEFPHNTLVYRNTGSGIRIHLDYTTWHLEQSNPITVNGIANDSVSLGELSNYPVSLSGSFDAIPNKIKVEPMKETPIKVETEDTSFNRYMNLVSSIGVEMITRQDKILKKSIRDSEYLIYRLNQDIVTHTTKLNELKIQQRDVALDKRRMKSMITKGHEPSMDTTFMDKIDRVEYQKWNNTLLIITKFIYIPYEVRSGFNRETVMFPIGIFKIQIKLDTNHVEFFNMTRVLKGDIHHPHILLGTICWGNFKYEEVLRSNNLAEILCNFISYLESYNHASPYLNLLEGWAEFLPEEDRVCKHTCKFMKHKPGRHKSLVNDEPRHPAYGLPMSMVPYVAIKFNEIRLSDLHNYSDMSKSVVDEIYNNKDLKDQFQLAINSRYGVASIINRAIILIRARMTKPKEVVSGSSN
jgi:hypothetical protein